MAQIIWTERSKLDYWDNIEYLEREWTLNDVYNFMDKVDDLVGLLAPTSLEKPTEAPRCCCCCCRDIDCATL